MSIALKNATLEVYQVEAVRVNPVAVIDFVAKLKQLFFYVH
jgi:hypothetical protein